MALHLNINIDKLKTCALINWSKAPPPPPNSPVHIAGEAVQGEYGFEIGTWSMRIALQSFA